MDTQTTTQEDKEILEIFQGLPQIIQDAITKSGWETTLRGIVSKYRLRVDQGTKLENMTFALMMGVMDPKEYFDLIHTDFDLENDDANALFQDIDEKIFARIEEMTRSLEKIEKSKNVPEETKETESHNFLKEGRETSSQDDEILTVTREEILRGIEDPEPNVITDILPDLKQSSVMPKSAEKIDSELPVKKNIEPPVQPTPVVQIKTPNDVEIREEQIPSNLPIQNSEKPKTLDPVDISLKNKISTSNKDYQGFDPYREPIE